LVPVQPNAQTCTGLNVPLTSSCNLPTNMRSSTLIASTNNIPIVYVSGRAFVPSTVVKPKQYGPKKIAPEDSFQFIPHPIPEYKDQLNPQSNPFCDGPIQSKPQSSPASEFSHHKSTTCISYIESESYPSVFRSPIKPSPLVVVVNPDSKMQTLAELTASIAESISNMVLESSNSVLLNSSAVSDAIMRDTQAIANAIGDDNSEVSATISRRTRVISSNSVAKEQESTIRNLASISQQTQEASSSASASTISSMNQISSDTLDSVSPLSKYTRDLQHAATVGLDEGLNKEVDEVVRSIMMATSTTAHKDL